MNWPCQARPALVNINSNEDLFYPFAGSVNKCGRSCSTLDDPCAGVYVPDKVKNMNVKVFFNVGDKWNKIFSSTWILWFCIEWKCIQFKSKMESWWMSKSLGVLVKVIIYGILVRVVVSVIRHVKLTNI